MGADCPGVKGLVAANRANDAVCKLFMGLNDFLRPNLFNTNHFVPPWIVLLFKKRAAA
jgi:hypothetical protein